jgi:hypothetical protein
MIEFLCLAIACAQVSADNSGFGTAEGLTAIISDKSNANSGVASDTKPVGWAFGCFQEYESNTGVHELCLTSMCSLLRTTNPQHVVAVVDSLAEESLGETFRANGVHVVVVPSINTAKIERNDLSEWALLAKRDWKTRDLPLEVYSAKKYYAWTLTQFSKLVWFDGADVFFLQNASTMLNDYEPFAAIYDPDHSKKRCRGLGYLNAGVILLGPGLPAFHVLMETYFRGNFTYCGGSGGYLDDQDPMTAIALQKLRGDGQPAPEVLGAFHKWPFCFNYRGWPEQQHCKSGKDYFLLHKPISNALQLTNAAMAREAKCRPFLYNDADQLEVKATEIAPSWNYALPKWYTSRRTDPPGESFEALQTLRAKGADLAQPEGQKGEEGEEGEPTSGPRRTVLSLIAGVVFMLLLRSATRSKPAGTKWLRA